MLNLKTLLNFFTRTLLACGVLLSVIFLAGAVVNFVCEYIPFSPLAAFVMLFGLAGFVIYRDTVNSIEYQRSRTERR